MSRPDSPARPQRTHRQGKAMMQPATHDPYRMQRKPPEPSWCPQCGAVFEEGRWQWKERLSSTAPQVVCPACQRERTGDSAGLLHVHGPFFAEHREELLQRLRHFAEHEGGEHAQQRILSIEDEADGVVVSTTSVRLARGLGQALRRAYHGTLHMQLSPSQDLVRLDWSR